MTSQFFYDVIRQERHLFQISDGALNYAAKDVSGSYSERAIKNGLTYVNYENPANRCSYMYQYAALHAKLVTKYFHRMMQDWKTMDILFKKDEIKICCMGGGPGTDFVGLCSVLAQYPEFRGKTIKLIVLDLCEGWKMSFNLVIWGLLLGKHGAVSRDFFFENRLLWKLMRVNLLEPLSADIAALIQEADIVCMVKFASAVIASPVFMTLFEEITNLLKFEAILLFIDNRKDVEERLKVKFYESDLALSFRPTCEFFKQEPIHFISASGCRPLLRTSVFVVGCIQTKVWESYRPEHSQPVGTVLNGRNYINDNFYSNNQISNDCAVWNGNYDFRNKFHYDYNYNTNYAHGSNNYADRSAHRNTRYVDFCVNRNAGYVDRCANPNTRRANVRYLPYGW